MNDAPPQGDMVLDALLSAARASGEGPPEQLVRSAYAIERKHQFDRDEERENSLNELRALIKAHLDAEGGAQ